MDRNELRAALDAAANTYQRRALQTRHGGATLALNGIVNAKWDKIAGEYRGDPLQASLQTALDGQIAAAGDPAQLAASSARMAAARSDISGTAQMALNGIRTETANNFMIPSLRFAALFARIVVLADDEAPYFQNNTRQEVNVQTVTGQDGSQRRVHSVRPQEEIKITMATLKTDYYEYALSDLYNGSIIASANANVDMGLDAAAALESKLRTLSTSAIGSGGSFGTFTVTGNKQSRVYVAHSFINTDNLPTTNDFTINTALLNLIGNPGGTVNSSTSGFRKEVFDAITWYAAAWGDAFRDGPVAPSGQILVPSSDVAAIGTSLGLATARQTEIAEEIQMNGFARINYLGRIFTMIPDNTLPLGVCYVPTNRPLFTLFLKPGMDREHVITDVMNNKESRAQAKVWGYYAPVSSRVNAMRIRYRT